MFVIKIMCLIIDPKELFEYKFTEKSFKKIIIIEFIIKIIYSGTKKLFVNKLANKIVL